MTLSEELFQKNIQFLKRLNPSFSIDEIDIEKCRKKSLLSQYEDEREYWLKSSPKSIHFPNQNLRSQSETDWVSNQISDLLHSENIQDFINIDKDVQLWEFLLKLRGKLIELNVDPSISRTTIGGASVPGHRSTIVALGTGSGQFLLKLLHDTQPYAIHIIVDDWHDLFSSFFYIDWVVLTDQFEKSNIKYSIIRVKNEDNFLWHLRNQGLFYLDHACLYTSPSSEKSLHQYIDLLDSNVVKNWIRYHGYTLDEYNMIVQASDTLSREPKAYLSPVHSLNANFIVCGSGPSLDSSLDSLKILQHNHVIVCGGSSYKALVENNIRVDFITLMERDYDIGNDDYAGFHQMIGGAPDSVHLVMAAECYHKMLDTFPNHCVFLRSSLTSATLFANNERQIIPYEAPEAVNTAFSLCVQLGANRIALVGVDLGSSSASSSRSENVLGVSNRDFSETSEGNFEEFVYTCESMNNVKQVLQVASSSFANIHSNAVQSQLSFFNCSNGVKINGFERLILFLCEGLQLS